MRDLRSWSVRARAAAAGLIVMLAGSAGGGDTAWQHAPASPGDWHAPANWTAGVPAAGDDARVDNGGTAVLDALDAQCGRLLAGAAGSGTLSHVGARLDCVSVVLGEGGAAAGTYRISPGAGAYLFTDQDLCVGQAGDGTFAQTGGTVDVGTTACLACAAGAVGRYELAGDIDSSLFAPEVHVGCGGSGTFTHSGGSANAGLLSLGGLAGSDGTYLLSGDGTVYVDGTESVGQAGTGSFVQTGGQHEVFTLLTIAPQAGSHGTYQLQAGWLAAEYTTVGQLGTATFTQSGGTHAVRHTLALGSPAGPKATYQLSGGQLTATTVEIDGRFLHTGGRHVVGDLLSLDGTSAGRGLYEIGGTGELHVARLHVGQAGSGTLQIAGPAATVTVTDTLRLGPGGSLDAAAGAAIHMAGASLAVEGTNPADLAGLGELTLIFEGGAGPAGAVEVAGEDFGPVAAGWVGNFALAGVQLGAASAGRIRLADDFDNQPASAGPEALYVAELRLNPGAAIDPAGLNLYYLNGGPPKQLFHGDATLDGAVSYLDVGIVATNYDRTALAWADGDFNGDRCVNYLDVGVLATNYGQTTAAGQGGAVPEPASTAILAAGASLAGLLRRQRH